MSSLKTFFARFLASFVALIVFATLTLIGIIIVFSILFSIGFERHKTKQDARKEKTVLSFSSAMLVREYKAENPLREILGSAIADDDNAAETSIDIFQKTIEKATEDENISAILIRAEGYQNSWAMTDRMRRALEKFKQQGKKIYVHGNVFSEHSYFLATVADSIFCSPAGLFEWDGLGADMLFYKNLIDKLDLDLQIFYAGKFKSATEPFRRENMSEENRLQMRSIVHFFYQHFLAAVSVARDIPIASLASYADALRIQSPQDAQQLKLIDGVLYKDEVDSLIAANLSYKRDETLRTIAYSDYAESVEWDDKKEALSAGHKPQIAVLYVNGEIVDGKGREAVSGDRFTKIIDELREENKVAGVVVRINSPGGSVQASDKIWRAVTKLKERKPVVVSFGAVAASGGYYIASGADYIMADPLGITGSIGVFGIVPSFNKFLKNKLGVTVDGVKTSTNTFPAISLLGMPASRSLNPAQRAYVQHEIESIYTDFKSKVARARKLSMGQVENVAQGRVWTSDTALKLHLVDTLAYLEQAIDKVATMTDISDYHIASYPKIENPVERLLRSFATRARALWTMVSMLPKGEISADELLRRQQAQLKAYYEQNRIMARMPYDIYF